MNRWPLLVGFIAVAAALALRCPDLERRPMHNDEAVNAEKLDGLWERGIYKYDPDEYHGPSLYYATLPLVWLSGARNYAELKEGTLRWTPVVFGLALLLLLPLARDALGPALLPAAFLTAVSPAMVFYSRYFIHEMLLVAFTFLFIVAVWRYTQSRRIAWAILAGAGLGLMHATKETFVLELAAMGTAVAAVMLWGRRDGESVALRPYLNPKHLLAGVLAAAFVSVLLFTSSFTHAAGPLDSIRTYFPWLHRAAGESPHVHPWYFYLQRLFAFHAARGPWWSEGLIPALAIVGVTAAVRRKGVAGLNGGFVRFLAIYTFVLTAIYSIISYKTPWCALGFLHGMILLAGVGAVVVWRVANGPVAESDADVVARISPRPAAGWACIVALLLGVGHLAWQAWRASFPYAADRRNPYVYAQTTPDILQMVDRIHALAKVHPEGPQMVLKVMAKGGQYWPLPWYLRQFERVGWWPKLAPDPYAPIMVVSAPFEAALDEKSDKRWLMTGLYELRPEVFFELYVQFDLWKRYVETLPRDRE